MTKKKIIFFLILIMAVGGFLRLWDLGSTPPGLYHDEAMNGNNALEALKTGQFKQFYSENNGREGLYINIQALSVGAFGNEPWALRLVSAIFGILTILGLYFLAKEFFSTRVALFSSFFLATSFWHVLFSRIGFRAIMAPFFLVFAIALLFMASRKKSPFLAVLAGLSFGLGFHSYIAYRIAPFLLLLPAIKIWKSNQKKIIIIFLMATFIAGLPLGIYFLKNPADFFGRTSQISVFSSETPVKDLAVNSAKTIGMLFFVGDGNWRHNFALKPELWWPVGILFTWGLLSSLWKMFKKRKFGSAEGFLILWILVMSLPVVISSEGLPHALRGIILIPPIMIFAGIGFEKIRSIIDKWMKKQPQEYPEHKKQILRIHKHLIILVFAFFAVLAIQSYVQYFIRWGHHTYTYHSFNGRYWDIGSYLEGLPEDTEKYVIVNAGGVLARDIPMPAQTIMFATDTYDEKIRAGKNIKYIMPHDIGSIKCPGACAIITMETDAALREDIKGLVPDLTLSIEPQFEILVK